MKCAYSVTYSDFVAAQKLHMSRTPRVKWMVLIFLRFMPVVGVLAAVLVFGKFIHPSDPELIILSGVIGAGAWGLVMALLRPYGFRRLYKQMKNGRPEGDVCEVEISDGQLISRIPGISEGRFLRRAIHRFEEDDDLALLYLAPKRFLPLPKRAIDEACWRELRIWLRGGETGEL